MLAPSRSGPSPVHNALGPGTVLGYCTNVHAGASLVGVLSGLREHAARVRESAAPGAGLGVGLWFSDEAVREALDGRVNEVRDTLAECGLFAYTLNAFPQHDFHQPVVKRRVYEPDWRASDRLAYSVRCAELLASILPAGAAGTISTLPLGWGGSLVTDADFRACARNLFLLSQRLDAIESATGSRIVFGLEPEPGCVLDTAADVVVFFDRFLQDETVRRRIGVCHDVCHSAVMFEPQRAAMHAYRAAGVRVVKAQLSSAVRAVFDAGSRSALIEQLRSFAEDRYLHQTVLRLADGSSVFVEDLSAALGSERLCSALEARVHFHVPVFVERFGVLSTTHGEIAPAVRAAVGLHGTRHFEVETYAWPVLPRGMVTGDLASGIAAELSWVRRSCSSVGSGSA